MKIKKLFALILALATLCTAGIMHTAATEETTTNLVQNPTFSNGMEGWTYSVEGDPLASVGGFADGEVYVKPAAGSHIEQFVPITETGTYRLSFKMKATVYNAATLEQAVYLTGGNNYTGQFSNDPAAENYDSYYFGMAQAQGYIGGLTFGEACEEGEAVWKEYELTVPVPSKNVTRFRIRLYFKGEAAPLGVDDIRFEKVNASAAAVLNGGMEYLNTDGTTIGGIAYASGVTRETETDGNHYMKLAANGEFRQYMAIDGGKTYRLSYRMKSQTANPLKFYNLDTQFFYKNSNGTSVNTGLYNGYTANLDTTYDGAALGTWKTYKLTFSVPEEANVFAVFPKANAECFLDDIAIEEVNKPFNYIFNGDFEGGTAGWQILNAGGTIAEEANGNRYYHRTVESAGVNYVRQWKHLPAGRYKLSYKAKVQTAGDKVGIALWDNADGAGHTAGWNDDFKMFKSATCTATFTDAWQTFNFYFSLPADTTKIILELPGDHYSGTKQAYFDDITLTKDENWMDFAAYTQESIQYGFAEAKKSETLTALRDAGDTIPVTAHYIPQMAGNDETAGTAETVYLIAALYETVGDAKKLVGLDIQKGITDVSDAAQKGRTAKGIVSLNASVQNPGNLSEKNEMKAFLINNDNLLAPAYKTMALGY